MQGFWPLKAGTMMTPVEPSSPAASIISRMVVSNWFLTVGSSARMKPSKPAQMADTLMFLPLRASWISLTRPFRPRPPGSKPTTPRFSMKSSFSARVSPGAIPSWKEILSGTTSQQAFLPAFEEPEAQPGRTEVAAIAALPIADVLRKDLLSIFIIYLFQALPRCISSYPSCRARASQGDSQGRRR